MPLSPERLCRLELATLGLLTPLFLTFAPHDAILFQLLALLFLAYIALGARFTRESIWGPAVNPPGQRWRRSLYSLGPPTTAVLGFCFVWAQFNGMPLAWPGLLEATARYILWALIQQTLFQFYLLGRLKTAFPGASRPALTVLNGSTYGLVHLPDLQLAALTSLMGILWTRVYFRDRLLLPVAVSHALLATGYYQLWMLND